MTFSCFNVAMINFLHTFRPESILFSIGPLQVHWYGFLMVVGGLIGLYIVIKLGEKFDIKKEVFEEAIIYFAIGAVIGARIYYVIYAWEQYRDSFFDIFKIWQGGLAVHGVMIGGFVGLLLFCRIKKFNFWKLADLGVIALVVGQIFGRNGNYFNQEIFGKPTDLPWGIPIDPVFRPEQYVDFAYFHPTFIYEVIGSLVILAVLLTFIIRRLKNTTKEIVWGNVFLIYLILYSILRFNLEFLRVDFSPLVWGVRWAQIFSVLVVLIVCFGLFLINKKNKKVS